MTVIVHEDDAGFHAYQGLAAAAVGPEIVEWERELRAQLGETAVAPQG